jgi:hypothetical protein
MSKANHYFIKLNFGKKSGFFSGVQQETAGRVLHFW